MNRVLVLYTRQMYTLYNLLFNLAFILAFPYLLLRAAWGKHGVLERMGRLSGQKTGKLRGRKVIWFHAASVGEVKALSVIIPQVRRNHPEYELVISTLTKTGKADAEKALEGKGMVFFVPVDLKRFVRRTLRKIKPVALILVETELWPNLIREAKKSGCFVGLVNGRISERSLRKYQLVKSLFAETLRYLDLLCVQSEEYKQRMLLLGAEEGRIVITGNLKFDRLLLADGCQDADQIRKSLHISQDQRVLVAGSTREGEEQILLLVFKRLKQQYPNLIFVLAPRHLNRLSQIEGFVSVEGLDFVRRTQLDESSSKHAQEGESPLNHRSLILLDTMGELSRLYCLADVAFVGGSLVPVGGHNLLEPAIYGVPVLFGPHVDNFKEEARILVESGGGIQVHDQEELLRELTELLSDNERRKALGQKAREAIERETGVAKETTDLIFSALEQS
jgi:3-deoxy-D-manno-octulosonic-acid transferase